MYHPVHSRASWTGADPIYSEMSPILKTVENSNFNHFNHSSMNAPKYTCESCSDHTQAHFFLKCVCGKHSCCNCSFHRNRCSCNIPFNCNTIIVTTPYYYMTANHDCKLEKNFSKLNFFDTETLRQISKFRYQRNIAVMFLHKAHQISITNTF